MNGSTIPERYVALCLRVDEVIGDFVDAYIGPSGFKHEALMGAPHDPRALQEEAVGLLEALPGSGLEPDRVLWLEGQLRSIECLMARRNGEDIPWSEEVERCFAIRPSHVDEAVFSAAHDRLDEVLPGTGDVGRRYNDWLGSVQVPPAAVPNAIEELNRELRRRTRDLVDLPEGETVRYAMVTGQPWQAYNWFEGGGSSLVQVNLDLPLSILDVLALAAHESYPGHHTERACKEELLYRRGSRAEMAVMALVSPEAVVAEGIATNALEAALGGDGFDAIVGLVDVGIRIDPGVVAVVHEQERTLLAPAVNVARMTFEEGMSREEAESYLQRWGLLAPERAGKMVDFLMDPASRTYIASYTEGQRLCADFMERRPDGLRRLLTEQLTVRSLLEDADA